MTKAAKREVSTPLTCFYLIKCIMLNTMTDEQKLFIGIAYETEGREKALTYLSIMFGGIKSYTLLEPKLNKILTELNINPAE